jgi:predicted metal-dependent hydrolase
MENKKTPELSLDGMKVSVIRSARKTVGLEIKPNGQNLLRAPLAMTEAQMRKFLNEKKDWLEKHLQIVRQKQEDRAEVPMQPRLTEAEIRSLADKALQSFHLVLPITPKSSALHTAG